MYFSVSSFNILPTIPAKPAFAVLFNNKSLPPLIDIEIETEGISVFWLPIILIPFGVLAVQYLGTSTTGFLPDAGICFLSKLSFAFVYFKLS